MSQGPDGCKYSRCPRDQMVENIKDVPGTRWLKILKMSQGPDG